MKQARRVVVTGLGLVCPVGNSTEQGWRNILAGKSGISTLTHFDTEDYPCKFGGVIRDFDVDAYFTPKEARKVDPFIHYAVAATEEAIAQSGLDLESADATRIGVGLGSGIGGIGTISETVVSLHESGKPRRVSPFFIPSSIINMASGIISIRKGLKGPNIATVTACTTGTHAIGLSARLIAYGDADVMIAGGTEAGSAPIAMASFANARALSTRNDDPEAASRPWDAGRDGFVLSDGAGVLVLEEYEYAKARGAQILAEVSGFGMSGDAFHITSPPEGGEGAARCMSAALNDAELNAEDVDYINAHGTSTPAGDIAETEAIKTSLGAHARNIAISSTKSMTGHLLGAAGGVEAVFSVLAIRDQVAPPTINLDDQDPLCDLDYVPHTAREMTINTVLSNSFGFGGTNGTLVFQKLVD